MNAKRRYTNDGAEHRYLYAACQARERLGLEALAADLGLTLESAEALIWAHFNATKDDTPYADCLDRGDAILAARAGLPVSDVENWIAAAFESEVDPCPAALACVLRSEFQDLLN
jgi:hypothetical protein